MWYPPDEAGVFGWLESDQRNRLTDSGGSLAPGLELRGQEKPIGWASFYYRSEDRLQAGFELILGLAHRRQGFDTEAARALTDFAFDGIGLQRLAVDCETKNQPERAPSVPG